MRRKICLIGRAGTGKTSIKKVLFEGIEPKNIMLHSPEPTRGIEINIYDWLDLEVGLIDTSGQELSFFLENKEEKNQIFENSNIVLYLLDYPTWTFKSTEIIKEIKKVYNILKEEYPNAQLIIIFHKIDLINQKIDGNYQNYRDSLSSQLEIPEKIKIFFTSIHPELIFSLFNAISEILATLSQETKVMKDILDKFLLNVAQTICIIINTDNSILVQSFTPDFDTKIVYSIQRKLHSFIQSLEISLEKEYVICFIDCGRKVLRIILGDIHSLDPCLGKLICLSEDFDREKIIMLFQKIRNNLRTIKIANNK